MATFFLALVFLLPFQGQAFTLSQVKSTPSYLALQEFRFSGDSVFFNKASNFFDHKIEYELGSYRASLKSETRQDKAKLLAILAKLTAVDNYLREKNSSFNDLNRVSGHESYLMLDKFKIPQSSNLYPEVKVIFDHLRSVDWSVLKRVRLSDDLRRISDAGGKESLFDMAEKCSSPQAPTFCFIKGYGVLFLEPPAKKEIK